jgi:flagellar secretion chaperone FliS
MTDERIRNFYLEAKVNNASSNQMLIMLYDGLIEQVEIAEAELTTPSNGDQGAQAAQAISRSINIITELITSLKFNVNPEFCGTLKGLYVFFTRELSEARIKKAPKKIRAILPMIRELRDAWVQADRRPSEFQVMTA